MTATASATDRRVNLTFHGIGRPTRELAPGEQDVWISAKRFVEILDCVDARSDVHLSFDDGNVSDVEIALGQLRDRRLTATFFIVAARLDRPGFLTREHLRELDGAGMAIGCHGMLHRPWRRLGDEELRDELLASRKALEEVVGHAVDQAACPFGSYDRRVLRSLRRYGYRRVFTSDGGSARGADWLQPRNSMHGTERGDPLDRIRASDARRRSAMFRGAKSTVKRWR